MKVSCLLAILVVAIETLSSNHLIINNHSDYELERILNTIPKGSEIIQFDNKQFLTAQLDGRGKSEIVAPFRDPSIKNAIFLIIISCDEVECRSFRLKGDGSEIDRLETIDITGDGMEDILLGTKIGNELNRLHVFSYNNDRYFKEFSYSYSKLEILKEKNDSNNPAFAFWLKSSGGCYDIQVARWNGYELVEATGLYRSYFKNVVEYYKKLSVKEPENPYAWYYLADSQIKAGDGKEAINSIAKGVALNKEYPTKQQFDQLKRRIR